MDTDRGYRTVMNIKGSYQLRVFDGGRCVSDTGEIRNLILNEASSHGDPFDSGFLCIGSGGSEPEVSQIELDSQIGQVAGDFSDNSTIFMDGEVRFSRRSISASFTNVNGDIHEVGFRKSSNGNLLSRTLIRDGNGYKTWVPLKSHQTLQVTFFVYFKIPEPILSGVLSTQFGQSITFTIQATELLSSPAGIMAGRFDAPFSGSALIAEREQGDIDSFSVDVDYNIEAATCTVTAYWEATSEERLITGFRSKLNSENLPEITLSEDLLVPVDNDITLVFVFSREE